jgi:hypothetical protein
MGFESLKSANTESGGAERRRSPRHASNLSAVIILDNGERIRCVVRDFSKSGALLVVPSVLGIPAEFNLQAATGQVRRVKVMRRGTSRLGVRFA